MVKKMENKGALELPGCFRGAVLGLPLASTHFNHARDLEQTGDEQATEG